MSDDYERGKRGESSEGVSSWSDYERGKADRLENLTGGRGGMDLRRTEKSSAEAAQAVARDPNAAVTSILRWLVAWTLVGGAIGYGVATFLGPKWVSSPWGYAIPAAGISFSIYATMSASILFAVIIRGRGSFRAFLLFLALTAGVIFLAWSFISGRMAG
jgi:hypothetical protein